jgi:hypothetical protein
VEIRKTNRAIQRHCFLMIRLHDFWGSTKYARAFLIFILADGFFHKFIIARLADRRIRVGQHLVLVNGGRVGTLSAYRVACRGGRADRYFVADLGQTVFDKSRTSARRFFTRPGRKRFSHHSSWNVPFQLVRTSQDVVGGTGAIRSFRAAFNSTI